MRVLLSQQQVVLQMLQVRKKGERDYGMDPARFGEGRGEAAWWTRHQQLMAACLRLQAGGWLYMLHAVAAAPFANVL
jgi:hypothetical protein